MASAQQVMMAQSIASGGGGTVTIDTVTNRVNTASSNTGVVTGVTVGSGSNRLLVVTIGVGDPTNRTVSSVTSSLGGTFANFSAANADDANFTRTEIWRLIAPATGSHTVTVTFVGTTEKNTVQCTSYTGCHQATPLASAVAVNGSTPSTLPTTGSMTVGTGELATATIATDSSLLLVNAGTDRGTLVQNFGGDVSFGTSTRDTTGAIAWDTDNDPYAVSGAIIKPN